MSHHLTYMSGLPLNVNFRPHCMKYSMSLHESPFDILYNFALDVIVKFIYLKKTYMHTRFECHIRETACSSFSSSCPHLGHYGRSFIVRMSDLTQFPPNLFELRTSNKTAQTCAPQWLGPSALTFTPMSNLQ